MENLQADTEFRVIGDRFAVHREFGKLFCLCVIGQLERFGNLIEFGFIAEHLVTQHELHGAPELCPGPDDSHDLVLKREDDLEIA